MSEDPAPVRGTGTDVPFERLYAVHHRAVLAYCARRVSRWDAWDAAAEVFVVAWRRIEDIPGRPTRPDALQATTKTSAAATQASHRDTRRAQ